MDKIAVLIPCYNEGETVEKVVTDWKRELPEAVIYVYDNNSSDGTAALAERAGAVVRHEYQQGKGNVIRRMFREIDAECYIMVDGDDTYPAEYGRQMAALVLEKNMRIENVIIEYRDRPEGSESKLNTYSDGMKVLRTIGRLYKNYRPMGFFGGLSAVMLLVAAAMFIPILIKFFRTGLVPNFPTLIVSGFIALAAIVSFFVGLILATIVEKDRQAFEFRLVMIEELKKQLLCKSKGTSLLFLQNGKV
ncbi:MAG: glycosyltransferase [Clostridiales bacterium]|nr:glycosyltransferase [Clostridiales bacterium]